LPVRQLKRQKGYILIVKDNLNHPFAALSEEHEGHEGNKKEEN